MTTEPVGQNDQPTTGTVRELATVFRTSTASLNPGGSPWLLLFSVSADPPATASTPT